MSDPLAVLALNVAPLADGEAGLLYHRLARWSDRNGRLPDRNLACKVARRVWIDTRREVKGVRIRSTDPEHVKAAKERWSYPESLEAMIRPSDPDDEATQSDIPDVLADIPGDDMDEVYAQRLAALPAALAQLDERDRETLWCRHVFGTRLTTLAKAHGVTHQAICGRLERAAKRVREWICKEDQP
jgi:RNA polymerase sigma factor (sigma-70 family)